MQILKVPTAGLRASAFNKILTVIESMHEKHFIIKKYNINIIYQEKHFDCFRSCYYYIFYALLKNIYVKQVNLNVYQRSNF